MILRSLRLTEKGKQVGENDARLLKFMDGSDKEGVFQYAGTSELRDDYNLTPEDIFNLKREGLIEPIEFGSETETLLTYAYELEVQVRLKEAVDELRVFQIKQEIPPVDVYKRYQRVMREYRRLTSDGSFF